MSRIPEDQSSEIGVGDDLFRSGPSQAHMGAHADPHRGKAPEGGGGRVVARDLERDSPTPVGRGWGRGPVPIDSRKFRYDVRRGQVTGANLSFNVTKVDRMDPVQAGDMLHRIHQAYGLENEEEARIHVFDKALFFEHTINGASMLQPGRGTIEVAGVSMDIKPVKDILGVEQRRFFRTFADDIGAVNQEVISKYDPYDLPSAEKYNQLMQVAIERGLQKYPHLAHDSSDAGSLSMEERMAVIASKARVIGGAANAVDTPAVRVGSGLGGTTRDGAVASGVASAT